jgi:16S rRNA G966 N2-methylase RsmD
MIPVRHRRRPTSHDPSHVALPQASSAPTTNSSDPALHWMKRLPLAIESRPIAGLKPAPRNARTHSQKQIQKIAASIRQFGFVNPLLVDEQGVIVAGHGRFEAAKSLRLTEVPVIPLAHLTPEQKRAYMLADNRLAELAGWDRDILAIEFKELSELDLAFEIEITGFEMAEIDVLIDPPAEPKKKADPSDEVIEPQGPAVTEAGDLWLLGRHRLLCGDAREPASYETLLAGEKAQMVFTDPPYNVRIDGHVSGLGRVQHREFVMGSGEMSGAEFTLFLKTVLGQLGHASIDGSIHFVCMDWRHMRELLAAGGEAYTELKNLCVWAKDNGGMGSFYRSRHELVFVFKHGTAPHLNNFGLGETGRYRTNVWDYAGVNTMKAGRQDELAMHPTVKPVALVADAIKDCSQRGGIVLDAFGGSGTTLIAAQKTGRRGYLIELDPLYVDVTIRRWQKLFKEEVHHAGTGLTFDEIAARRLGGEEVRHG